MTPLESIEKRITELDEEISPIEERLKTLIEERTGLVRAKAILTKRELSIIVRQKWSPELLDSIETRIAAGVTPQSIAEELGMKRQSLYAVLSYYRKEKMARATA